MTNQEQERLKRLREKQLQSRDPLAKQRQFQHSSSIKEKRMRKSEPTAHPWPKKVLKYRQISADKMCVETDRYGG